MDVETSLADDCFGLPPVSNTRIRVKFFHQHTNECLGTMTEQTNRDVILSLRLVEAHCVHAIRQQSSARHLIPSRYIDMPPHIQAAKRNMRRIPEEGEDEDENEDEDDDYHRDIGWRRLDEEMQLMESHAPSENTLEVPDSGVTFDPPPGTAEEDGLRDAWWDEMLTALDESTVGM
jgi:hypothetical protein